MSVPYRPLGHIREVVASVGLEITYVYDDLVYIDHNAFLLQMGAQGERVNLYFNTESSPNERGTITRELQEAGQQRQLDILRKGTYAMSQKPGEEAIEIQFFDGKL